MLFIIKVATSVGLINASRDGGIRSFWSGVGSFTGRGLILGLVYLITTAICVFGAFLFIMFLIQLFDSDAASFWISIVILPIMMLWILAWLDLAQDYSLIRFVKEESPLGACFAHGFRWTWQHRGAVLIYAFWYGAAFVLVILPTFLDSNIAATTGAGVLGLFFVQQVSLGLRSASTVGWFASEVRYFEDIEWSLAPLIASTSEDSTEGQLSDLPPESQSSGVNDSSGDTV
jgi:hypothetical protein